MFLPLSAGRRAYPGLPWATLVILLVNGLVFAWEAWLLLGAGGSELPSFIQVWGFTPQAVLAQQGGRALTAFTSMYLHGSPGHIFFNLLFLWVFAPLVEELTGPWRFLAVYHLAGLLGAALTLLLDGGSASPHIGASGAVAGVLGAFLLLYPGQRVRTLIFIGLPLWPRLPAWLLLGAWLVDQAALGQAVLNVGGNYTGIGVWAHLGGFAGGLALVTLFLRPDVLFNRRGAV